MNVVQSYTGWRKTWSPIVVGNLTGNQFDDILFIDPVEGAGYLNTTDGQGNCSYVNSFSNWQGYKVAALGGLSSGAAIDLLLYNPVEDSAQLYGTSNRGSLTPLASFNKMSFNLGMIVPTN